MDSLSDILKALPTNPRRQEAEANIERTMKDPLVTQFKAKYPFVDEETMRLNRNKVYQYVMEQRHCTQCPGLHKCPNDMVGHYTYLEVEPLQEKPYIHERKIACKKFIADQNQQQISKRIHTFYVDPKMFNQKYTLENILTKDIERASAVNEITTYMEKTMEEGLQTNGLYVVGSFGTGKTFLMCYMLHNLAKVGLSGAIVYMPDFAEDLKSMFNDPQKLKETIDLLKETDLLVFDDIGAENLNPWFRDHVIGAILNTRMNRKPTFFTSNYELNSLEKHFSFTSKDGDEVFKGQRIMDRITPFVDVVIVKGSNKRGKNEGINP
jgi:primosomal protein DnaI